MLHQKWLESLKKDLVNEVNTFEQKVAAAMQVLEQRFQQISQRASRSTESSADVVSLQHLVQRLTGQVTLLESQSSDLKFSVNTNLKAQGTKLGFCVEEIRKIVEHILDLEKKNAEMVAFQAAGESRNLETRQRLSELRFQAPLDNADLAAQVASLQQKMEDQIKTQNMLAARMGDMADHCYAMERNPESKVEVPTYPVLSSERPWYERVTRILGEEDNFDPLPVFRQHRYISGAFPKPRQERSEWYPEGESRPRILHLPTEMGKDKEKPIDVDETLNPRLGGYLSLMHDAESFVPPCVCCLLLCRPWLGQFE